MNANAPELEPLNTKALAEYAKQLANERSSTPKANEPSANDQRENEERRRANAERVLREAHRVSAAPSGWTWASTVYALSWLTAIAAIVLCVSMWPDRSIASYDALFGHGAAKAVVDVQRWFALGYLASGIIVSILIAGFGRALHLLETMAARQS
jgi:hypothetical protein